MHKPVFSPGFLRELAEACPLGPCSPELVQSWFDIAWPKMKARGYRNWKSATANWWSRVRDWELEAAEHRLYLMAEQAEETELELLAADANEMAPEIAGHMVAVPGRRRFRVVK